MANDSSGSSPPDSPRDQAAPGQLSVGRETADFQSRQGSSTHEMQEDGTQEFATRPSPLESVGSDEPQLPQRFGQYEVLDRIGGGGMGQVYRVRHTRLQREFALKTLPRELVRSAAARDRFAQEILAAGRLDAPHIVRTTDAGEHDGLHYLVMEYIDGVDLDQVVRRHGPLSVANAAELVRQAAVGLMHIAKLQMVHRDLKPANLILDYNGSLKILDLGLAKLHAAEIDGLTTAGAVMGTIDYMAPEQANNSADVDIRADLYSLGATLYFLLCGEPPLRTQGGLLDRLRALTEQRPVSLSDRRADIPSELSQLVDQLLEKPPEQRFADPTLLADRLARFASGADLVRLVASTAAPREATPAATTVPGMQRLEPGPFGPRRRWAILAGILAVALISVAGFLVMLRTRDGEIQVEVDEQGATVFVDDEQRLIINSTEKKIYKISAPPGLRKLRVELPDGTRLLATDVQVLANKQTGLFRARLVPMPTPAGSDAPDSTTPESTTPTGRSTIASRNAKVNRLHVTVSKDGTGDFTTIGEALAVCDRLATVRILDDAEYREMIRLNNVQRHEGVTLESPRRATIIATEPGSAVWVTVPRVTIRGLRIRTEAYPMVMCKVGWNCGGTVLEDLDIKGRPNELTKGVNLESVQPNSPDAIVHVRRCHIESCEMGISVFGINTDYRTAVTTSGIAITDNLLIGNPTGIQLIGDVRRVVVAGNRITGSFVYAMQLEQMRGKPGDVWIVHNSLHANRFAFRVWDESVVEADVYVLNNLTLDSLTADWVIIDSGGSPNMLRGPGNVADAQARWKFAGNWREGERPVNDELVMKSWLPPSPADFMETTIPMLSRDLTQRDYLRPPDDSPLLTGANREYAAALPAFAGALPAADAEPYSWDTLALELLK